MTEQIEWRDVRFATAQHRLVDTEKWVGREAAPREWLVPNMVPWKQVTMLYGDGGLGKSLLAMQLGVAAATSALWLGQEVRPVKVFGLFCEDDEDEIERRIKATCSALGVELASVLKNFQFMCGVGRDNALRIFQHDNDPGQQTDLYRQIFGVDGRGGLGAELGAELFIFDSLYDVYRGNQNSQSQPKDMINALRSPVLDGGAVLVTAHPSLSGMSSGSGLSGNVAWHNACRSRFYLSRDGDDDNRDRRTLSSRKANYGPEAADIRLEYQHGVFVPVGGGKDFVDRIVENKDEEIFLKCLDVTMNRGGTASLHKQASSTYAPKLFSRMPESDGTSVRRLTDAMERLLARGSIREGQVGSYTNRNPRRGIVRAESNAQERKDEGSK